MKQNFSVGDIIQTKRTRAGQLGKIIERAADNYTVEFSDGTTETFSSCELRIVRAHRFSKGRKDKSYETREF